MAQHDNGRRAAGHQGEPWQQGNQGRSDPYSNQQDQAAGWRQGGQQGGQRDDGPGGQHSQFGQGGQQQGDTWRDAGPARGGYRPGIEDRSGQGSFGGQATDNDYGNRGITESGNYGQSREALGSGSHDQGAQRFGQYRHGYDARSDSAGGYGPGSNFGSGNYGRADWNQGQGPRTWQDNQRFRNEGYGQSAADRYSGYSDSRDWQSQGPSDQDRYGANGYQGNWQRGQGGGQSYHDPDYHQWRSEQLSQLDRDYDEWRQHRYQRFADEFNDWRGNRNRGSQGVNASPTAGSTTPSRSDAQQQPAAEAASGGKSQDASSGGAAKSHK
jgi:hypothetical protein